jgi:hypothetical protein
MSEQENWSRDVAILAADALHDAKILQTADIGRAIDVIAEEIFVRLTLGDYPPRDSQSIA